MQVFEVLLEHKYLINYWNCVSLLCILDYDALDEMGNRIDELENSINDLRAEMGVDDSPSLSAPSKPKVDTKSGDDSAKE